MKNTLYIIKVIVQKEIIDTIHTFGFFLIAIALGFNLCIYITDTKIIALKLSPEQLPYQLGLSMMYLMAMAILFLGTTLTSKLIYEEKRNKTMHMLLSMGITKEVVWMAKMCAIIVMCTLFSITTVLSHIAFVFVKFSILMKFNWMSFVIVFIMVPIIGYGFIAITSVAYMYFSKMNFVGMFIQIVPYLAIWEVSSKLIAYTNVPLYILILSVLIGIMLFALSFMLVRGISKERIVSRVD
ncbi:ABC transporter permease subunit [Clostridium estertheticum]|uniref:ABC transporter permease subunit n=1 Tax=Clostridium estertheticum TaxID=238834 RepID=A0A7Y3T051_9CLOT|nr:ABC transporter permease subunit [Clostridium estertheticum]NNU78608.1 ABC transporter permease subunit [Clostridium estertheticum]WBL49661.1 ABC transporter permease subunit [Clostridium estertheticum]